MIEKDLIYRLRKRAEIRRGISSRKSVQEGKPDRLADLLDEAADALGELDQMRRSCPYCGTRDTPAKKKNV